MNNFEKMKRNISDQILGMNVTEFYEFVNFIENQYQYSKDSKKPFLDLSEIFTCKKCKKMYECDPNGDELDCKNRFIHYCSQE